MKTLIEILAITFAFALNIATVHAEVLGLSEFSLKIDTTFATLYVMDGFRVGGEHPVMQPSVELTTPLKGVSASFWTSFPLDRTNQSFDEYDLIIKYQRDFALGSPFAFNLHGFADYWYYPKLTTTVVDAEGNSFIENNQGNKLHAGVSLINLIPLFGSQLVPTYNVYYSIYWENNQRERYRGGAHHELMLSYYHNVPRIVPLSGVLGQYVGMSGTMNYEDGLYGAKPGWSHATAQLSTGITARGGWAGFLSLNKQWSYIASVNPHDEFWTNVSLSKNF